MSDDALENKFMHLFTLKKKFYSNVAVFIGITRMLLSLHVQVQIKLTMLCSMYSLVLALAHVVHMSFSFFLWETAESDHV
jgi:hypothetical protein